AESLGATTLGARAYRPHPLIRDLLLRARRPRSQSRCVAAFEERESRLFKHVSSDAVRAERDAITELRDRSITDLIVHVRPWIVREPNASRSRDVNVFVRKLYSVGENRYAVERAVLPEAFDHANAVARSCVFDIALVFSDVNVKPGIELSHEFGASIKRFVRKRKRRMSSNHPA